MMHLQEKDKMLALCVMFRQNLFVSLLVLFIAGFSSTSSIAADFCITGLKGTASSAYIFKVALSNQGERHISILDANRNALFTAKTENRFTQFNTTGYGVCSLTASGTDEQSGAHYKVELKVAPHSQTACKKFLLPTSVEYITLKITPKGTTLGDDLTAYALALVPCP